MDTDLDAQRRFVPPFCPNPKCLHHRDLKLLWRWKRAGFHRRQQAPFLVQRFTCLRCRRGFSTQTFATTYWLKRPDLPARLFMRAVGGMANRQIARDLRVAPSTIDRAVG